MSDRYEQTIGNALAKVGPAVAGASGSATLLGLGAEHWAMLASIATFAYALVMLYLALPRIFARVRDCWRNKWFNRKPDHGDDGAGA